MCDNATIQECYQMIAERVSLDDPREIERIFAKMVYYL